MPDTPKPLVWTEPSPPTDEIRYHHTIANTPFGRFVITWKGWKEYESSTVDETPWGDYWTACHSVEQGKRICEAEFAHRLKECFDA